MLKDTHIDIKFSLAGEKKTVPPYICRMFFRQIQTIGCKYLFYKNTNPLQNDIQKNKTAIPACMSIY